MQIANDDCQVPNRPRQCRSARGAPKASPARKSLCRNRRNAIPTSLFDFHIRWSDATYTILQKMQPVEIEVATQTRKGWEWWA
jgi:hypothetical protein